MGEKLSGKPSELIELERRTAAKLGIETAHGDGPATLMEQVVTHGGRLALSALAGLAYVAAIDARDDDVRSGALIGLAFFVAAYGITGPLLGITPLPWREQPLRAVQHPLVHTLFGIGIALAAGGRRSSALPSIA